MTADPNFAAAVDSAWSRIPPSVDVWESLTIEQRGEIASIFDATGITLPIDWPENAARTCVLCRHWRWEAPCVGFSFKTGCERDHWQPGSDFDLDRDTFATKLLTARNCGDFALSRVALENMPEEK